MEFSVESVFIEESKWKDWIFWRKSLFDWDEEKGILFYSILNYVI